MQPNAITSTTWLSVAAIFGLLEFLIQFAVVKVCPFTPVGDEIEYIERGHSPNPYRFRLFHRPPILPTMAKLGASTGHPVAAMRLASVILSSLAMAATAGAASRVGGSVIASGLCLIVLMVPERIALGSRLWPDVYLAAATSSIALIFTLTPSPLESTTSAILTGFLVTFAVLVRIDALVLIPAAAVAWFGFNGWSHSNHLIFLVGPPVTAFLGWWLISKIWLGENWPDTTWRFNLGIAVQDALAHTGGGTITTDDLIERHRSRERSQGRENSDTSPSWNAHIHSMASRLRAMIGPDTFVSGKLLADYDHGCVGSPGWAPHLLLRRSTPLLIATAIVAVAWRPTSSAWLALPSLALLVSPILFHARTRYRLPLVFGLIPCLAGCLNVYLSGQLSASSLVLVASAIAAITAILARKPLRLEKT